MWLQDYIQVWNRHHTKRIWSKIPGQTWETHLLYAVNVVAVNVAVSKIDYISSRKKGSRQNGSHKTWKHAAQTSTSLQRQADRIDNKRDKRLTMSSHARRRNQHRIPMILLIEMLLLIVSLTLISIIDHHFSQDRKIPVSGGDSSSCWWGNCWINGSHERRMRMLSWTWMQSRMDWLCWSRSWLLSHWVVRHHESMISFECEYEFLSISLLQREPQEWHFSGWDVSQMDFNWYHSRSSVIINLS